MSTTIRVVLGVFIICAVMFAQGSTAQINGTVRDASGLAVPGAEVKATQTATGAVRTVATGADGAYILSSLPVGPYTVEVSKDGFTKYVQAGIILQVGSDSTVDIALKVGSVSEQVVVEANAALVETRATGVGQVMDITRVLELPLNGRNAQELVFASGVAVGGGNQGTNRNYPTDSISVAGGLNDGLTYTLDGATHNDPYNNLNLPFPFPDALQEFKMETSSVPAQYGQHSAGVINIVSKAGTNAFHGDLFYFLRNGNLNARNTFALRNDGLKRNQFGGVLGGPIIKNKLFFFVGEQGTIIRSAPLDTIAYVPTPDMLKGDWTAFTSPACNNGTQIALKGGFANNQISPTAFSTVAFNLTKHLPIPQNACGRVTFGQTNNSDEHIIVARSDYQISEKHSMFGRYQLPRLDNPSTYDGTNVLSLTQPNQVRRGHSFAIGDTYLFGSSTVSSFHAAFLRTIAVKTTPDLFTPAELGQKNSYYPNDVGAKLTLVNVSGGFNLGNGSQVVPGFTNSMVYQLAEDLSMVRGAHQIAYGVNFIHTNMNAAAASFSAGPVTFNATNTGASLGDFMLGRINSFTQTPTTRQYMRQNYTGLYVQDTWKVSPRLTANIGLRWEPYSPARDTTGHELHFTQQWFDQGLRSTTYKNAPVGVLFNGDPGMPGNYQLSERKLNNFAPRLGLAWDPQGNGKMTIRAAYGIFYDYPHLYNFPGIRDDPPWGSRISLTNPPGGLDDPWLGQVGGNPFPVTLGPDVKFPLAAVYTNMPVNFKNSYVQQWNLSVQRQLGANWLVTANYLGNEIVHAMYTNEGNPAIFLGTGPCSIRTATGVTNYATCSATSNTNQRRLLNLLNPAEGQYYANIVNVDDGLTRSFNGMVLSAQHRAANGFTLQMNYTLSHCLDIGTNVLTQLTGTLTLDRRRANRGNCELDRRHNFNLTGVYKTPRFQNRATRMLASNWQLSGIVRVVSGAFMTIGSGIDRALSGTTTSGTFGDQRPNQVLGDPYAADKTINSWLNPAAFTTAPLGTYGTTGRMNVQGAGAITINAGLVRQFTIWEGKTLEVRGEAFNLPNHVNPGDPTVSSTPGSTFSDLTTFGKYLSAQDPRIVQVAMKFVF